MLAIGYSYHQRTCYCSAGHIDRLSRLDQAALFFLGMLSGQQCLNCYGTNSSLPRAQHEIPTTENLSFQKVC